MKQSRLMSLVESVINIVVGLGISLTAQAVFLPLLGVAMSLSQNLAFALIMTVISIGRSFVLRRVFEALHIRHPISPFMLAVTAERRRQVEQEGWTPEHDDQHEPGELASAGAAYSHRAKMHLRTGNVYVAEPTFYCPNIWPWETDWWKPAGFRRDLVKGCALIAAEGEKFDRNRRRSRSEIEPQLIPASVSGRCDPHLALRTKSRSEQAGAPS